MGTDAASLVDEKSKGIVPRAVEQILSQIFASDVNESTVVKVMFQEIYLDSIRDLLDKTNFMTQNN